MRELLGAIDDEKDALLEKMAAEKADREEKTAEEIRKLAGIIDEKAAELAAIRNSRAYQILRKTVRLFDRSQP